MKYIHVYALFLMSVFITSCGQNQTGIPQDNINPIAIGSETKDIGPNIMVRNIKKGSNGTILIAGPNNSSFGDVYRYDARLPDGQGKSFTNLTSKAGSHRFWDVLEDRRGNIWFATTDSGVYYYNTSAPLSAGGKSFQHFTTAEGIADNRIMCVYEDKAGIIWLGTGNGLSRYDGKSFRNFKNPNPSRAYKGGNWNNDITTIIEDKTGKLWVGTRGAAFVYDGKTFTTLTHKGKPFMDVWAIMEDRKGNIWLSGFNGSGGLWRYDPSTSLRAGGGTFTKVSERGAYAIIEDKKGNIWTTGSVKPANPRIQALSRYDAKSLYSNRPTVTEIMSGKAFFGLLEANDGSIWFGDATGVYRYDGKTITDFYNKEDEKKYVIDTKQSVVIWKGSMLISGSHTGNVYISKGELMIEKGQLVGGTAEIDMNTIEHEDKKNKNSPIRDIKSPLFFDVKKFPVSTFVITKVETGDRGSIKVTGNLTIKGITNAVTFPAKMDFKDGMDGTVEANGRMIIDRTDWGISFRSESLFYSLGDITISDDIELVMKIVAKK